MELIIPTPQYLVSYNRAKDEFLEYGVTEYEFLDGGKANILKLMRNYREGINLPEGYVPATYLWLTDQGEFVGEVSIRHELTEALQQFGGHIGYGIRATKWKQGYGTMILKMSLEYAYQIIGLKKILITCNDNNIGSYKIIEQNGGILQDKITNIANGNERLTRRYWINCS